MSIAEFEAGWQWQTLLHRTITRLVTRCRLPRNERAAAPN